MESASGEPRWPAFTRTPYSYPGSLFTVLEARSRRPFGAWPRRVALRRRRTLIFGRRTSNRGTLGEEEGNEAVTQHCRLMFLSPRNPARHQRSRRSPVCAFPVQLTWTGLHGSNFPEGVRDHAPDYWWAVLASNPDALTNLLRMPASQAGRRGFESRLPLHLFNNLHALPNQLLSHLSQLEVN